MTTFKKITKYSIFFLFLMLPIIDCIRRLPIKNVEIFGFSIIELLNIVIIGYTFFLTLFNLKNKKRDIIPLIIYTIVLLGYLGLHCLNIVNFDSNIYVNSKINIITELYYILRVYYMPVLLLFILIKNKDIFDLKFYSQVIKTLICIISFSIIILNICKISYATYAEANNEFLKYNMFDFYFSNESFKLLSTRGWFDSANEIAVVLLMLLPINIFLLYKENKKFNLVIFISQFISMIILGTRLSSLGAILITVVALFINLIARVIKNTKMNYKLVISGLLCTGYFFISPVGLYLFEHVEPNYSADDQYSEYLEKLNDNSEIINYIYDHLYEFRINEYFVKNYPIENDITFWKNIALGNRNLNNDSRVIKTRIIQRIYERNDNKYDKLLGMGYTVNFMDLERDYIYQYYLFGILGLVLIIPQLIILGRAGIMIFKNITKCNLIYNGLLIMSPFLGLVAAYFSGHFFGCISPSYIFILVLLMMNYFVMYRQELLGSENQCQK